MSNELGEVAADSSFYICFLDDINNADPLIKILGNFKLHIPPKIHQEITKSKNWHKVGSNKALNVFTQNPIILGKALEPFFSKKQLEKGESEIIVVAYVCSQTCKGDFYFIIDDGKPRKFIENNCKDLLPFLYGTLGFLKLCVLKYSIFNKSEVLTIIDEIGRSKFDVTKKIIDTIKAEIEASK